MLPYNPESLLLTHGIFNLYIIIVSFWLHVPLSHLKKEYLAPKHILIVQLVFVLSMANTAVEGSNGGRERGGCSDYEILGTKCQIRN